MTLAKAGDRAGAAHGMGDRCQQPCTPPVALVPPIQTRSLQTYQELGAQGAPSKLPCSNPMSPEHRVIFGSLLSTKKTCASRSRRASGTSARQNPVAPTTLLHPDMGATTHVPQYNPRGDRGEHPGGPSPAHLPSPGQPHTPASTSTAPSSASSSSSPTTWGGFKDQG